MGTTSTNSKFIRITPYCLVEYIYNDVSVVSETEDYAMYLIDNQINGTKQCYCDTKHLYSKTYQTNNVEKYAAIAYSNNRYAVFDEKNNIFDYNKNLIKSEKMGSEDIDFIHTLTDTVRFHFISGYSITDFASLIFTVRNRQTDNTYNFFLSTYLSSLNYSDLVQFNSTPIFLTNSKFDRYVEYKIPSIKNLNNDFYTSKSRKDTSAAWLSRDDVTKYTDETLYRGFTENAPIVITLDECSTDYTLKTEDHSYYFYDISNHYESSISQYNEYDNVNATIEEASDGNYFIYGMRYGDGSVENFIDRLSSGGEKWDIIHQLIVYENDRNGESTQSSTITLYQEDDFDEYMTFRPVLKNASIDTSFSIDYQARLLNETTGEQIIRTSSCMSLNVNKYGKNTIGIKGLGDVKPYKVYNRLFKGQASSTELYVEPTFNENSPKKSTNNVTETKVQYPLYVDYNKISVEPNVVLSEELGDSRIIFKQYDLRLILKPMDMFVKFTVYEEVDGVLYTKNLNYGSEGMYNKLVFDIDNNSAKITIDAYTEDNTIFPEKGQIMFFISEKEAAQILASSTNDFYIVSYNYATSKNNVIYTGFWMNQYQVTEYKEHIKNIETEYATAEANLQKIRDLQDAYEKGDEIASNVYVPGYVDEASNNSEVSPVLSMRPSSTQN